MHELQVKYQAAIRQLVDACHRCAELNFVTSAGGNLSQRVDENVLIITPTKTPKRTMREEDICVIDLDGNVLFAPDANQ